MAKKAKKVEGTIKNDENELPVDFTAVKDDTGEKYHAKTVEAQSTTKLEDDKGEGQTLTLRFFDFAANPLVFKERMPTAQELFQSHLKQIEIELWKDQWEPVTTVEPRIMFAKDKSHYRIVIAAKPVKGSFLSYKDVPHTLSQYANAIKK